MTKFGAAQSMRRVEDQRFLMGTGRYTADVSLPRQAYAYVLRSPHASARIERIDIEAARKLPGVIGIYTAADIEAEGIGHLPCLIPVENRDGSQRAETPRPALAKGRVRHVGDPVALVVAESLAEARDAAEGVTVDYTPLAVVSSMRQALTPGATAVWDETPGNVCFDCERGDRAKTEAAFASAAHVVRLEVENNRIVVAAMEPRAALADYDRAAERFTLVTNTQGAHLVRQQLADAIFRVPANKIHVITPDVGGGFGMKLFVYPEHVLTCFAARKLGRPVKWVADRSEAFLCDTQGRDNLTVGELALDAEGKFLALRVSILANLGGYLSNFAPYIPLLGHYVLPSVYGFGAAYAEIKGVFTNTVPVDAYRGAGRPEGNYLTERLIDAAARELDIPPDELRRRNFIPPSALPYTTVFGVTYDSGAYRETMEMAMQAADWAGFPQRAAEAKRGGFRRGIGMAYYLEATAGPTEDAAEICFEEDGTVSVLVGTQSTGQGHETAYTQIVSERLGVPPERIHVIQGDSDRIRSGGGTGGARSLYTEGGAILATAEIVVAKGKEIAGHVLEAAPADIEFRAGDFRIAGTDRKIAILELAEIARDPARRPPGSDGGLDAHAKFAMTTGTYPNGCHIAEVEVDEATGRVAVVGYTVADDMGKVINPMIVEGQVHGGIAQGIGQALLEHTVYDAEGQLLSGSFMDYCLPRADDLPSFRFELNEVPCTTNPLGVKGAGEAGAVGAAPAVINAVIDALKDFGIRRIDMPATPERIWRAIRAAKADLS